MAANSKFRRIIKRVLFLILPNQIYGLIQAITVSFDLKFYGYKEPELLIVKNFISHGDVVVDIGANFGQWSVKLSNYVGPNGRVISFEPIDYTYRVLLVVLKIFDCRNVIPIKKAIANIEMDCEMCVPVSRHGTLSTGQAYLNTTRDKFSPSIFFPKSENHLVKTSPLDSYIDYLDGFKLSLIKIDVEGAEIKVLEGAKSLILAHRPIIVCEVNPAFVGRVSGSIKEILLLLDKWEYKIYFAYENGSDYIMKPLEEEVVELNYIFLPVEKINSLIIRTCNTRVGSGNLNK